MALTIDLTAEEEARLREEASRQGVEPEELVVRAVKNLIPPEPSDIQTRLARLDRVLLDPADDDERKETWDYLKKALDEDRLSYRKFFP